MNPMAYISKLVCFGLLLCVPVTQVAYASEWAEKLFKQKHHDFGTVGRNAKTEYSFEIENCFEEDVRIASVRSSCGCTNPVVPKKVLKSWEKGEIIAQFNTKSFIGDKSASITVVIDRPYYAEVTLLVKGKIRSDIVLTPGEVNFGDVDLGTTKDFETTISYSGRKDWNITDVRGDIDCVEVRLDPVVRTQNTTNYKLKFRLKENAPVGDIHQEITIVTDDPNEPLFKIPIFARINPPISITPKLVSIGSIKNGQTAQTKLLLRSKKPVSITSIDCDDERIRFEIPTGEKTVHIIPMTLRAQLSDKEFEEAIQKKVRIQTSLGPESDVETTIIGKLVL